MGKRKHRLLLGIISGWLLIWSTAACAEGRFEPVDDMRLPQDLKLLDIDDQVADIETGRPVLINLWASWCGPCLEELPSLNRLRQRIVEEKLAMVALNYGDPLPTVRRFVKEYPLNFQVLLDLTRLYSLKLEPVGLPTSYLVDRKGWVRFRYEGKARWDSEAMLTELRARLADLEEEK